MLARGTRGLGFGCGREPLVAVMASRGCEIVAADLEIGQAGWKGRIGTGRHARTSADLNERGLCDPELFRQRVSLRVESVGRLSPDLDGFDFLWSNGAVDHLGSLHDGIEFVVGAMRCLKPGGLAIHTMGFNLTSNYTTLESRDLALFRRCDVEALADRLARDGHAVAPLSFNAGSGPLDRYVDLPPYRPEPHLRLRLERYVATSFGLIVRRKT
jgi:hypothetical protein